MERTDSDDQRAYHPNPFGIDYESIFGLQNTDQTSVSLNQFQPSPDPDRIEHQHRVATQAYANSPIQGVPGSSALNFNHPAEAEWSSPSSSSPSTGSSQEGPSWHQNSEKLEESQTTLNSSGIWPKLYGNDLLQGTQEAAKQQYESFVYNSPLGARRSVFSGGHHAGSSANILMSPVTQAPLEDFSETNTQQEPNTIWEASNPNPRKRAKSLLNPNNYQSPDVYQGGESFQPQGVDAGLAGRLINNDDWSFGSYDPRKPTNDESEFEFGPQPKRRRLDNKEALGLFIRDLTDVTDYESEAEESRRRNGHRRSRIDHGELSLDSQGRFVFRAHGSGLWEPTQYHESVRRAMIEAMHDFGDYDHPPARGLNQDDLTALHPEQRRWRCDGHQNWHPSQDGLLYRFEQRGLRDPDYEPGPLRFQGSVILNSKNQVITDWTNLPLTISSKVEGCRMENLQRQDSRITIQDIMDRQPNFMATKRSALTQRTGRFRTANGLLSWNCRDGTEKYKTIMLRHLTREQISRNTTRGYHGLTKAELRQVDDDNKRTGKYNARAGRKSKR